MKLRIFIAISLLGLLCSHHLFAQEDDKVDQNKVENGLSPVDQPKKLSRYTIISLTTANRRWETEDSLLLISQNVGWYPLTAFDGGLSFDYERRLGIFSNNWIKFKLTGYFLPYIHDENYYWNTFNSGFDDFRSMKGVGLGINYKSFFRPITTYYWSAGIAYNFYKIVYKGESYEPFTENGMNFYEFTKGDLTQNFNKLGANLSLGYQTSLLKKVFTDFYITIGYTYSFYDENKFAFDNSMLAFGHRGAYMSAGFRIGFPW